MVSLRGFLSMTTIIFYKSMRHRLVAIVVAAQLLAACIMVSDSEKKIREDIGEFAVRYFNYDFAGAAECCTPESKKWISLAASQMTEADLDVLRAQKKAATAEVTAVCFDSCDSLATVTVRVTDFMQIDTVSSAGHIIPEAMFGISAVCRDGRWFVRMACPLRSER